MNKFFKFSIVAIILLFLVHNYSYIIRNGKNTYKDIIPSTNEKVNLVARTNKTQFEIFKDGKWEEVFLKGVNIGAAKPGYFPGDFGITKEDYLRWFRQIKDMNCNVIRIYTLSMPAFYEALYEFNKKEDEPLYIIHGTWLDEEGMKHSNAFNKKVIHNFMSESEKVLDAIHGNAVVEEEPGQAYGKYTKDISPYVIGYILGIEWDSYFVERTNKKTDVKDYNGKWFYTEGAKPTEIFFAKMMDHFVDYEFTKYGAQKPVAMTNWLTTDVMEHKEDIDEANRIGDINTETIKSREDFKAGIFVSYHVYPYYPDYIHNDKRYNTYVDENGEVNTYRGYLKELKKHHNDKPLLVSEFGIPESRGLAHLEPNRGFNQGMVSEKDQGIMNAKMVKDIKDEGYCGAIVFSWQDEWFKRTWNTMDIDNPDERAYWGDKMTNEEYFGLLSFEPGLPGEAPIIDGNVSDWSEDDLISSDDKTKLYVKSDEEFIYLRVNKENLDLSKEEIVIPVDVTPMSGSKKINGYNGEFDREADFLISITGKDTSKVLIQDYYDTNNLLFDYKVLNNKNSDKFYTVKQAILKESFDPVSKKVILPEYFDIGNLIHGTSNSESADYNSLSDFYIGKNDVEIRIPWLMLNISAPTQKQIVSDFNYEEKIKTLEIDRLEVDGIYMSANLVENKTIKNNQKMNLFTWEKWEQPTYHEKLKQSYYIMKEAFRVIE